MVRSYDCKERWNQRSHCLVWDSPEGGLCWQKLGGSHPLDLEEGQWGSCAFSPLITSSVLFIIIFPILILIEKKASQRIHMSSISGRLCLKLRVKVASRKSPTVRGRFHSCVKAAQCRADLCGSYPRSATTCSDRPVSLGETKQPQCLMLS